MMAKLRSAVYRVYACVHPEDLAPPPLRAPEKKIKHPTVIFHCHTVSFNGAVLPPPAHAAAALLGSSMHVQASANLQRFPF